MNGNELLQLLLSHLRAERGLAETTVKSYERILQHFFRALGKSPLEAQREDLREFLAGLNPLLGDSAKAHYVSALRQFYKFLQLDRYIKHDPTQGIRAPKQWRRLPRSIPKSDILTLLHQKPKHVGLWVSDLLNSRDEAIFELMYGSGLRVSELTGAHVLDLKLNDR